jgi:transposase
VHFHFTPTHASWLNQVELWFSILARQLLSKRDFKSVEDLTMQLLDFIEQYNKAAGPFAWVYKGEPLKID